MQEEGKEKKRAAEQLLIWNNFSLDQLNAFIFQT
jgi:hypothetical protein